MGGAVGGFFEKVSTCAYIMLPDSLPFQPSAMSYHILLTIDVEDWFQVENFKPYMPFSSWSFRELRVEKNTHRLLDLFDSIKLAESSPVKLTSPQRNMLHISRGKHLTEQTKLKAQSKKENCSATDRHQLNEPSAISYELDCQGNLKATFFVLGWVAKRLPNLIREIHSCGHEVASHGYYHNLCDQQPVEELKRDLTDSKKLLEDIIGSPVFGYRAPSFAINNDILKIIEDCGYLYDSSYNSFAMHGRYGKVDLPQKNNKGIALQIAGHRSPTSDHRFYELPISNLKFSPREIQNSKFKIQNLILPWGGGGYFRLIPSPPFMAGVKSILKKQNAYLFYIHPWEVDPEQPRVNEASAFFKFRHYINLSKTHSKLLRLIQSFQHCHFITCSQYLSAMSFRITEKEDRRREKGNRKKQRKRERRH